jgi:hypothetical protein
MATGAVRVRAVWADVAGTEEEVLTSERKAPKYGEGVISWLSVWDRLLPEDFDGVDVDAEAGEMQRLKGLVVGQAAEVEEALETIAEHLEPQAKPKQKTFGQLAKDVRRLLGPSGTIEWAAELQIIDQAVGIRNRAAHGTLRSGSTWWPYETGGGEWVVVMSFFEGDEYYESDLRRDLALQQEATEACVRILHAVKRRAMSETELDAATVLGRESG